MIKETIAKLVSMRNVCFAMAFAGMMSACSDDVTPSNAESEFTEEELAEMAAVDKFAAANSVYRALGLMDELPDNWENATFTPAVGVALDEANTDIRNVISTGAGHAEQYFLSIVPDLGLNGHTWSHEGVGSLTYRAVNEKDCYAVIDVNLVQMPGLKQLRFVPEEVVGENSFSGVPYYNAGDIVRDKNGIYWICVRPSGGPLKKDNAYFVSFDKSLIKTATQKQDIYKSANGKVTKEKLNDKSGQWNYAKNLVEERIAIATAHTFAMMYGCIHHYYATFENMAFAQGYYDLLSSQSREMGKHFEVGNCVMNKSEDALNLYRNNNAFAVAYGSYVKNKQTKVRQEKYLQPFLILMHDGQMSDDGTKMKEMVVKCWDDPKTFELSSMPYSLTTDYDPLSFEYFSGYPIKYNGSDFYGDLGYYGIFDIMNYTTDVPWLNETDLEEPLCHMSGYYNDYVMVLTQLSVKDNGQPYKNFTTEVSKYEYNKDAYWKSLDQTERLVYSDGKVEIEKNIYE